MKYTLVLLSLTGFASMTSASIGSIENLPVKMQYFKQPERGAILDSTKIAIESFAATNGLETYYPDHLPVEAVLTDKKLDRVALISVSRRANAEYFSRAYYHRLGHLLHVEVQGQQVAVFLLNHTDKEVVEILKHFIDGSKNYAVKSERRKPAGEAVPGTRLSSTAGSSGHTAGEYAYAFGRSTWSCIKGINAGFNAMVIDPFVMAGKSLKVLANDPPEWWETSVDSVSRSFDTIASFRSVAKKKWRDFAAKPADEQSHIYCEFLGGVGAAGAVSKVSKASIAAVEARATTTAGRNSAVASDTGAVKPTEAAPETKVATTLESETTALKAIDEIAADLASTNAETVNAAIRRALNLKQGRFTNEFSANVGTLLVQEKQRSVISNLKTLILNKATPESVRLDAMAALVAYGRTVSGGWQYGWIGIDVMDELGFLSRDLTLSDPLRRIAHTGANEALVANRLSTKTFQTAAQLKEKYWVDFLGKSEQELSPRQFSIGRKIERNFQDQSRSVKEQIYSSMLSGRGIPVEHLRQYVQTVEIRNRDYLTDALMDTGFKKTVSPGGQLTTWRHPSTQAEIIVPSDINIKGNELLKQYTGDEIAAIKAAMTAKDGRYTITNDHQR